MTDDAVASLLNAGDVSSATLTQDAASSQINTAETGTTGTTAASLNNAWGKAIPELIGHTRTVGLPLWTGNPQAGFDADGNETDSIDFAVLVGKPGPRSKGATVTRVWFDNNLVYDANDPTVTTLLGQQLGFDFYDGTQTTPNDDMMAANNAIGMPTPAFTGRMYAVFYGIITRTVNAATTTTAFTKLPEVQLEVTQSSISLLTGATFTPFQGMPADVGFATDVAYFPVRGLAYVVRGDSALDVYNTADMQYIGRQPLAPDGSYTFSRFDNYAFSDNVLVQWSDDLAHNQPVTRIWNINNGNLLYSGVLTDPQGNVRNANGIINCGAGWFIPSYFATGLAHWDGTTFTLFSADIGAKQPSGPCDYFDAFNKLPGFDGKRIVYFASGSTLYRVIVTDGTSAERSVGNITYDGGNVNVKKGTYCAAVLDLSGEAGVGIRAIFCDNQDPRFVYIVTSAADGTASKLRKIANFFYYNPQTGGAPPAEPFDGYANFDFHQELSYKALNNGAGLSTSSWRDRRYPYAALPSTSNGFDCTVVNFRAMSAVVYAGGNLYDAAGNVIPTGSGLVWPRPALYIPQSKEVFAFRNVGQPSPGKLRPRAASGDSGYYMLGDLMTDLATMAGYDNEHIKVNNLPDLVMGQQLNQSVTFRDLTAQYCATFRIDMTETPNGGVSFNKRLHVDTPDVVIPAGDLIPIDSSNPANTVSVDRVPTNELPALLQLAFIDPGSEYRVGAVQVRRTQYPVKTVGSDAALSLSVPIVMAAADATWFAGTALFDMWAGITTFTINLPPSYIALEPGDFVQLTRPSGRNDLCKVTQVTLLPDRSMQIVLSSVNKLKPTPYYQSSKAPTQAAPPKGAAGKSYGTMTTATPFGSYTTVIDNVMLNGYGNTANRLPAFVATSSPTDFYTQINGNVVKQVTTTGAQSFGAVKVAVPASRAPLSTDTVGTITVTMGSGQAAPVTCSDADFAAGLNNVAIGAPGRWEIVYFRDVAHNADGSYTLSHLLRGRFDSDVFQGQSKAGDVAVFGAVQAAPVTLPVGPGAQVTVYGMAQGVAAAPRGGVYDSLATTGATLAPLPPQDVRAARQPNGDVLVTWHRRDRQPAPDFWSDPPLSDTPEQYNITIGSRNVNVSVPSFTYTAAMQSSDNFTGSQLAISLYQVGAAYAQGYKTTGTYYVQ